MKSVELIKGKHWPIPYDEIVDGTVICLKNANRLADDAELAFQNNRYTTSLSLSTLALEEFGKMYLLLDAINNNKKIDEKIWKNEFENHEIKLKAIPKMFEFLSKGDGQKTQAIKQLKIDLVKLSKRKIESIYVDWDGLNNKWYHYDDKKSLEKKKEAEDALKAVRRFIKYQISVLDDDKELAFISTKERVKMLLDGKIHCFCGKCGKIIMNKQDMKYHNILNPMHLGFLSWHMN